MYMWLIVVNVRYVNNMYMWLVVVNVRYVNNLPINNMEWILS